jgi:hypothetical protein
VAEQQNPDGLPTYVWHQFTLHCFFGHQPDRPTGATLWRVVAHHGDNPLFLCNAERVCSSPIDAMICGPQVEDLFGTVPINGLALMKCYFTSRSIHRRE